MPLPKPKPNEAEDKFITRCMSNEAMQREYEDNKQRLAVCFSQWKRRNRSANMDIKSLFVKTEGIYEKIDLSVEDCIKWFKEHSDDEGNVKEDVMLYENCQVKADKEGMLWTMSDDSLDRDMERFDSAGWDLKTFKKNPIVLWGHNQDRPAIGKVLNPKVVDKSLMGRIIFSSAEIDPFAAMIEAKIKEGIISSGSVAFKPMKIELITDEKDPCKLIYRKQDLREFSICNIPSNVNAVYNPEKAADYVQVGDETMAAVTFINPELEQIKDDIEELKTDVETLKDMQMKQAVEKKDNTYFDKLFSEKKEPKTNWFANTFSKK